MFSKSISLFGGAQASTNTAPITANQTLVELFMLKKVPVQPRTDNYLYRKITNNVCSLDAQLKLYNSFETNKSSQTILDK